MASNYELFDICCLDKYENSLTKLISIMHDDEFSKFNSHIIEHLSDVNQSILEIKENKIKIRLDDFIKDRIKVDANESINDEQLYETFKSWWKLFEGRRKMPKGKLVFTYITEKFGKKVGRGWKGISILDE